MRMKTFKELFFLLVNIKQTKRDIEWTKRALSKCYMFFCITLVLFFMEQSFSAAWYEKQWKTTLLLSRLSGKMSFEIEYSFSSIFCKQKLFWRESWNIFYLAGILYLHVDSGSHCWCDCLHIRASHHVDGYSQVCSRYTRHRYSVILYYNT